MRCSSRLTVAASGTPVAPPELRMAARLGPGRSRGSSASNFGSTDDIQVSTLGSVHVGRGDGDAQLPAGAELALEALELLELGHAGSASLRRSDSTCVPALSTSPAAAAPATRLSRRAAHDRTQDEPRQDELGRLHSRAIAGDHQRPPRPRTQTSEHSTPTASVTPSG